MRSSHLMLVISSLRSGGAERVVVTIANAMAEKMPVTIVCLSAKEPPFYLVSDRVDVIYLDLLGAHSSLISAAVGNLARLRKIRGAIKEASPSVIVSFMLETNVLMVLARLGLTSGKNPKSLRSGVIPLVVCEHTDPRFIQHKLAWRILRKVTYRHCDRVVVLNDYMKDWFEKATSCPVDIIPNPIEITTHADFSPSVSSPYLLGMGRLIASKGFDQLIMAFGKTQANFPDWNLVIAGEGDEKTRLKKQIEDSGLTANVHLIGNTARPHDWMNGAEIFASASTIEAFPMAICEAMMSTKPVVALAYNDSATTLIPADAGVVIPLEKQTKSQLNQKLTDALLDMMSQPKKRKSMGRSGKENVEQYTVNRVIRQWQELFDDLAGL